MNQTNLALAICYELSVREHTERAVKSGADMYIASVAKFADGVAKALNRLADIAKTYSMPVFMPTVLALRMGMNVRGRRLFGMRKAS